ncbi:hypothetical protein [Microbacterium sp. RURRCA19A]|uniref:hypothetical protein n=1 Tax=Microbacterium sp. RURRCA19A TaxID=1907391 RepID=UPI000955B6FE|nr:hypothetical protein [Microbacterium sp. RURRCA19A]SIS19688.1 hypothetical protein SAMN05880568_3472 [Microbacterium sp. RURRCA19A]
MALSPLLSPLYPSQARARAAARAPRNDVASSRKKVTDRLGLPADAPNDQVLAAFDTARAGASAAASSEAAGLAQRAWGEKPAAAASSATASRSDLYRKAWG